MITQLLLCIQVVCCTCTGAGDPQLASHSFRVVVIDEATQVCFLVRPGFFLVIVPTCRVGQNHTISVYIRCDWQEITKQTVIHGVYVRIYGIRRIYGVCGFGQPYLNVLKGWGSNMCCAGVGPGGSDEAMHDLCVRVPAFLCARACVSMCACLRFYVCVPAFLCARACVSMCACLRFYVCVPAFLCARACVSMCACLHF